jgi:hypothetical protein
MRPGTRVPAATTGIARAVEPISLRAEEERQKIIHERCFAGSGGAMHEQRSAGMARFDGLSRDPPRDGLRKALKAAEGRGIHHRPSIGLVTSPGPMAYFVHRISAEP